MRDLMALFVCGAVVGIALFIRAFVRNHYARFKRCAVEGETKTILYENLRLRIKVQEIRGLSVGVEYWFYRRNDLVYRESLTIMFDDEDVLETVFPGPTFPYSKSRLNVQMLVLTKDLVQFWTIPIESETPTIGGEGFGGH